MITGFVVFVGVVAVSEGFNVVVQPSRWVDSPATAAAGRSTASGGSRQRRHMMMSLATGVGSEAGTKAQKTYDQNSWELVSI